MDIFHRDYRVYVVKIKSDNYYQNIEKLLKNEFIHVVFGEIIISHH